MDPAKTCSTCKFFCGLANQCRIRGPLAIPVMGPGGKLAGYNGYWPPTQKDFWCGEWQPEDLASIAH